MKSQASLNPKSHAGPLVSEFRPPKLDELERAFGRLVDALVTHRLSPNPLPSCGWTLMAPLATPAAVLKAKAIVDDPVSYSLKRGIKSLGQTVYDLHGMGALRDMAERVCDRGVGGFQCRMAPVDSALNGVGRDNDRWWS